MTDLPDYDNSSDGSRPSFIDYWKRSKQQSTTKNITFVQSNFQQKQVPDEDDEEAESSKQNKSEARRAQVRKAQIQHRQRKANYTTQLEMDITKLREMIYETENDCHSLRGENEAMRRRLTHSNPFYHAATHLPQHDTTMTTASSLPYPEYTVSLGMSEIMNTPAFQITRTPSASSEANYAPLAKHAAPSDDLSATPTTAGASSACADAAGCRSSVSMPAAPAALGLPEDVLLTEAETDEAINFILALEHICWNHFQPAYFQHEGCDPAASEHGHALMASAIALQGAPDSVFARIDDLDERERTRHLDPHDPFDAHTDAHTDADAATPSWRAATPLTLRGLHGLASALNAPDREVAPVQAWFEIARAYGVGTARDAGVMGRVARELAGVVKCLHFGAVIERDALDSVLGRVVGPVP